MLLSGKSLAWLLLPAVLATAFPAVPAHAGTAVPAHAGTAVPAQTGEPVVSDVAFTGDGGVPLRGKVIAPESANGRSPGIVIVHGAGPVTGEEYRDEAEAYARRGIVTLIYDKRTTGYSTFQRDYEALAGDALAAVRILKARADVNPKMVGIWGLSEGAWVAPIAAARSADVAFLVLAGAVGTTPPRQQAWAYGERLRHAGVHGSMTRMLQERTIRFGIGSGLFAQADYDPTRSWERVHQPVLALWGTLDREAMPAESSQVIRQALDRGGNAHHTVRFLPGVRHNLNRTFDEGFDRPDSLPADYAESEAAWIKSLADGPPPSGADQPPSQDRLSRPVDGPFAWYESPRWQLAAFAIFLTASLGYPLAAIVRRLRGRRGAPPAARPARWLVITVTATALGFLGYFCVLILTGAYVIGPVVLGRPVPWLVLQFLAGAAVVAAVATATSAWRHRRELGRGDRVRLGLVLASAVAFVPWAAYWGLLMP
ncbi:prolyl oligopeptidase family serine peptidase [Streptosporangium canum]|uniref:alpha/beta hydrolase family protein n=1 Tax=Streptosporangium canum TaxID=324952 RepID=UPI00343BE701